MARRLKANPASISSGRCGTFEARAKLAIETSGAAEVTLWGFFGGVREQLQPSDTGTAGRLMYDLDCAAIRTENTTPLLRIALLLGTGEEAAEVELSVEAGGDADGNRDRHHATLT